MRKLPLLMIALVLVVAVSFGIAVMLDQPAVTTPASPVTAPSGLPQGHVYAGVTEEPDDVNPFTSHSEVARRFVLGLTHEGLVDTDPASGELRGAAADSWRLAADGMSATFHLRDGLVFSDGTAVTMADVLFGWQLAHADHLPLGFVGDAFGRVADARAADERTLELTFRERYYATVRAVGEYWLVAQRQFFVDRVAALAKRLGVEVPPVESVEFANLLTQIDRECGPGTGPMMLPSDADGPTTWRQRQDLTLVRNPHHWRRLAEPGCWNIGGVRLLFRSGPSIFTAVLSGEIDWVMPASVDAVLGQHPELAEHYRKLAYDYETLGVVGILWNCRVPALQDVRVRRALAMLLDREAIVAGFPDTAVPAVAFAKPGTPAYPPGPSDADGIEPLPFDPPAARALLRDAGFDAAAGKPLALHVLATPDGGIMDLAVDLLRDACKQAGVELTVDTLTFAAYVAKKTSGDWDGILMKRSFRPWGDPFDFVHSGGLDNDGDWQNAEADRLATAARRELDEARRCALWHELHALVYREQPFAFLVHPRACILFNKFVENAEPGPRGLWPERWWVAPEHQRR